MDEPEYLDLAERTFRSIEQALDAADAEDVDCERAGDVLTLTFKDGRRCVLNTQRPTRQLWLAANARAWHFSFDAGTSKWLDDKGKNEELFATLAGIIKAQSGIEIAL
jgi:CyaY protein